jgi:hypothetical protein
VRQWRDRMRLVPATVVAVLMILVAAVPVGKPRPKPTDDEILVPEKCRLWICPSVHAGTWPAWLAVLEGCDCSIVPAVAATPVPSHQVRQR